MAGSSSARSTASSTWRPTSTAARMTACTASTVSSDGVGEVSPAVPEGSRASIRGRRRADRAIRTTLASPGEGHVSRPSRTVAFVTVRLDQGVREQERPPVRPDGDDQLGIPADQRDLVPVREAEGRARAASPRPHARPRNGGTAPRSRDGSPPPVEPAGERLQAGVTRPAPPGPAGSPAPAPGRSCPGPRPAAPLRRPPAVEPGIGDLVRAGRG